MLVAHQGILMTYIVLKQVSGMISAYTHPENKYLLRYFVVDCKPTTSMHESMYEMYKGEIWLKSSSITFRCSNVNVRVSIEPPMSVRSCGVPQDCDWVRVQYRGLDGPGSRGIPQELHSRDAG